MRNILITGAARGLGLALVRAFTDAGDAVAALCRESSPALDALAPDIHTGVDVANAATVRRAAAALGDAPLDVVINNAGIMIEDDIDDIDIAAVRQQFEVNALGCLNVALSFRRRLRRGARLVNISSRLGSTGANGSGGDYGYRMSKAALGMLTANLAIDLAEDGVTVVAITPGLTATDMSGGRGAPPDEVARDLKRLIDGLGISETGRFLARDGSDIPW